jgi:pilus assembly protein CpaB
MNAKALIPLLAGLGVGGLALKLGFDYVQRAKGSQSTTVQVWAAVEDIPRGAAIEESMLRPAAYPASLVPKGAFTEKEKSKLVGRVPKSVAPGGVPVLESMLLPEGSRAGLWVPPGFRAVAVRIDEASGVDNHLQPGARVDVVGYFTVKRSKGTETVARTLIENVEIAAVGPRQSAGDVASKDDKSKRRDEKPARAVTLFVKPDEVPILHLAEQRGKLKLSMRGLEESGATPDEPGGSDQINERKLVMGDEEIAADGGSESAGSLLDTIKGFLQARQVENNLTPPAEPRVAMAPPPPPPKQYQWRMAVWNGDSRRVLGWEEMNSIEPEELDSSGPGVFDDGPNVFDDRRAPKRKAPPSVRKPQPLQPPPADDPEEPEPQEESAEGGPEEQPA